MFPQTGEPIFPPIGEPMFTPIGELPKGELNKAMIFQTKDKLILPTVDVLQG
jgi:hypothetical protein